MEPGQYATPWAEYTRRMEPNKYNKFADCFHRLIQGTNVYQATSMLTVGIGEWNIYGLVLFVELQQIVSKSEEEMFFYSSRLPLGQGEFETLILEQSLTSVDHVIAVEPDVEFNSKIKTALNPPDGRTIKVSKFPR